MLRRYGNVVKSTVPISGLRSGKNSSKDGASSDMVENRSPVLVIYDLSSTPYNLGLLPVVYGMRYTYCRFVEDLDSHRLC
jgi:hypothetical protein